MNFAQGAKDFRKQIDLLFVAGQGFSGISFCLYGGGVGEGRYPLNSSIIYHKLIYEAISLLGVFLWGSTLGLQSSFASKPNSSMFRWGQ